MAFSSGAAPAILQLLGGLRSRHALLLAAVGVLLPAAVWAAPDAGLPQDLVRVGLRSLVVRLRGALPLIPMPETDAPADAVDKPPPTWKRRAVDQGHRLDRAVLDRALASRRPAILRCVEEEAERGTPPPAEVIVVIRLDTTGVLTGHVRGGSLDGSACIAAAVRAVESAPTGVAATVVLPFKVHADPL